MQKEIAVLEKIRTNILSDSFRKIGDIACKASQSLTEFTTSIKKTGKIRRAKVVRRR